MGFESFNEIYSSLPIYLQVIGSILGFIFVAFIVGLLNSDFVKDTIKEFFNKRWKLFKKKKGTQVDDVKSIDIDNHNLFNYIDFWIYNQIPSMTLKTRYRTIAFRKYLHFFFHTHKEKILHFLKEREYKHVGSQRLKSTLLRLMTEITIEMENKMRKAGIPEVIIVKMKNEMNDKTNLTRDLIESISDSSFYDSDDNLLKVYSFLNIIHSILDNTISNIEPVCNNINGELSGLTMEGVTEPISKKKKKNVEDTDDEDDDFDEDGDDE